MSNIRQFPERLRSFVPTRFAVSKQDSIVIGNVRLEDGTGAGFAWCRIGKAGRTLSV